MPYNDKQLRFLFRAPLAWDSDALDAAVLPVLPAPLPFPSDKALGVGLTKGTHLWLRAAKPFPLTFEKDVRVREGGGTTRIPRNGKYIWILFYVKEKKND